MDDVMPLTVRKAGIGDVPGIRRIDRFGRQLNTYRGLDKLDSRYKSGKSKKSYYGKFINGKKKWCYIAEENGKIIGFILFKIEKREPYFRIKKVGYIDLLFVDKKARGKNASKLLLKKAYEVFRKEKIRYLKLSVHSDNPALKMWKKSGFRDYRIDMFRRI